MSFVAVRQERQQNTSQSSTYMQSMYLSNLHAIASSNLGAKEKVSMEKVFLSKRGKKRSRSELRHFLCKGFSYFLNKFIIECGLNPTNFIDTLGLKNSAPFGPNNGILPAVVTLDYFHKFTNYTAMTKLLFIIILVFLNPYDYFYICIVLVTKGNTVKNQLSIFSSPAKCLHKLVVWWCLSSFQPVTRRECVYILYLWLSLLRLCFVYIQPLTHFL